MKKVFIGVFLCLLLAAAASAASEPALKVKVMVAVANIRSGPAPDASVVATVENGKLLDVVDKVGDWYLVSLPDGKKGYVINAVVTEVAEEAKPPVAAPPVTPPVTPPAPGKPAPAEYTPGGGTASPLEIGLFGGFGLSSVKGTSVYADNWTFHYLTSVTETTNIAGTSKNAVSFGGSLSYFFSPNIGVQLAGGYFKADVPTTASFTFIYTWSSSVGGGGDNKSTSWSGTGSLSVIPLSLNVVGRFGEGSMKFYVFGGPTMYFNSFQAASTVGYGDSLYYVSGIYAYQYVDAFAIPAQIPQTSWSAFGGDIGAGVSFQVASGVAIGLDARYYLCGSKDFSWTFVPGTGSYTGLFYQNLTETFGSDLNTALASKTTTFKVNPSFFAIGLGIKIGL